VSKSPTLQSLLAEHWHLAKHLRQMHIAFDPAKCQGIWECFEVCPVGCWQPDLERRIVNFVQPERCIACGACVLQCPEKAITLIFLVTRHFKKINS
jgi:NAD-dependent dihydropyrimidine dehydrogenase PreA subunit